MGWDMGTNIKMESLKDIVNFKPSHEIMIPSVEDYNVAGIEAALDEAPDDFVFIDFLGATYTVFHKMSPDGNSRALMPQVVKVEGKHFTNVIKKMYWPFAEEYFWQEYETLLWQEVRD